MQVRPFGTTGLTVSALGFGCGAIGGLMTRGERREQLRTLGHALEAGIIYFDTARSYGNCRSEENVGAVLSELRAHDRVVVGTKVNVATLPTTGGLTAAMCASVEGSRRRPGRDFVHILHLLPSTLTWTERGSLDASLVEQLVSLAQSAHAN